MQLNLQLCRGCITNERFGRRVFFGAMVTESIVALIWAAAAMTFFGGMEQLNSVMVAQKGNAAYVVNIITNTMLGKVGAVLAILGVVAAPITSGDTAFRGARLVIADFLKMNQQKLSKRLIISVPLFIVGGILTQVDFSILWRYFAWSNQTLAVFVLWAVTVYLIQKKKFYWITLIPAIFMTAVCSTYLLVAPEGLNLSLEYGNYIGISITAIISFLILRHYMKKMKN